MFCRIKRIFCASYSTPRPAPQARAPQARALYARALWARSSKSGLPCPGVKFQKQRAQHFLGHGNGLQLSKKRKFTIYVFVPCFITSGSARQREPLKKITFFVFDLLFAPRFIFPFSCDFIPFLFYLYFLFHPFSSFFCFFDFLLPNTGPLNLFFPICLPPI